jgi:OOP family OmpA-OmpF porin
MTRDKRVLLAAMLGATVMAAPAVSMAQARGETGWYAGITLGQSEVKSVDCTGFTSCDAKDTAFRILGGYQINRNFAAELGYHDLGKVKVSAPGVSFDIKSNAWELVGVGAYPLANQFSVYGKLGFYRGETKVSGGGKDTNTDLTYGIGGQYDLSREVGIRAEWQRYGKIGGDSSTGGTSDVDVLSIGAIWRFR